MNYSSIQYLVIICSVLPDCQEKFSLLTLKETRQLLATNNILMSLSTDQITPITFIIYLLRSLFRHRYDNFDLHIDFRWFDLVYVKLVLLYMAVENSNKAHIQYHNFGNIWPIVPNALGEWRLFDLSELISPSWLLLGDLRLLENGHILKNCNSRTWCCAAKQNPMWCYCTQPHFLAIRCGLFHYLCPYY